MHDEQMFRLLEKFIVLDNVRAVFQKRKAELRILATRKNHIYWKQVLHPVSLF